MGKDLYFKIYDTSGNYKGVFFDFGFSQFDESINSGLGTMTLVLPLKFDELGDKIALGYQVKVYVSDKEVNSELVYSGYIGEIGAEVSSTELVQLTVYGYITQLEQDILQTSSGQLAVTYKSYDYADLEDTIEDIIDKFKAYNTLSPIDYTASSIATTGKAETFHFKGQTYLDALKEVAKTFDAGWYFRMGADDNLYVQEASSIPDHYFLFGRDVVSMQSTRDLTQMKNGLIFWNGKYPSEFGFFNNLYSDSASMTAYGRQVTVKIDERYLSWTGTMDEYGAQFIAANKDPFNQVTLRIADSNYGRGYDIESIKVGDTCKVLNIESTDLLSDNMIITNKVYSLDYIDITVADVETYIDREVFELRKEAESRAQNDIYDTYD